MSSIDSSDLERWLFSEKSGCFVDTKIEVKATEYGGRGLFTKDSIRSSVPIIKISHSYLLNFTTIVAHIASFNDLIHSNDDFKHIRVTKIDSEGDDDIIDKFYSKVTLDELLELTSFQILSMYIVLEKERAQSSWWSPFLDQLPDIHDFTTSPFIWKVLNKENSDLFDQLPNTTIAHADKMLKRFQTDYDKVEKLLKIYNVDHYLTTEKFLLAWMCVNSRCLYMEIPQSKNSEGNFTMAPYVDFINHSSVDHCVLKIDRSGFYVKTPVEIKYSKDEELFLSYGPHSNEFLLCEYGFILPENQWNDIDITEDILNLLTPSQIEYLKEKDYYGDYTLSYDNISFRTEIALAVSQESSDLYFNTRLDGLLNGITDGSFYKSISNRLLKRILLNLQPQTQKYIDWVEDSDPNKKTIGKLYQDRLHIIEKRLEDL